MGVPMGVPIARPTDRHSRKKIIVAAMPLWSMMTTPCGPASFMALFRNPAFCCIAFACEAHSFVNFGLGNWTPPMPSCRFARARPHRR